jgi:hypothetical protein
VTSLYDLTLGSKKFERNESLPLSLEVSRSTLDTKLRDNSNSNQKWQVKANTRGQAFGSVMLKFTLKKASWRAITKHWAPFPARTVTTM